MDVEHVKKRMLQGSMLGALRLTAAVPIYIALTPFMLDRLGAEMFGVWSFNTIIVGVLTLTDFGFKNSLIYHAARAGEDHDEIRRHFSVAILGYLGLAALTVAAVTWLAPEIARDLLRVPSALIPQATFVLTVTAISFGLRFLALPYQAVIEARQELYFSQLVALGWLLLHSAGTAIALWRWPNVYALGAVSVAANVVVLAAYTLRVRSRLGFVRLSLEGVEHRHLRELVSYGAGIQVATLAIALREPIFKALVSRHFDLQAVTTFEVCYRLSTQIIALAATPLLGTFVASALLSRNERDLERVVAPLFRFSLALLAPLVLFVCSFAEPVIQQWLGPGKAAIGQLLPAVFIAFTVYYATEALYKSIEGSGRSRYSAAVQMSTLAIGVVVFLAMAKSAQMEIAVASGLLASTVFFSMANLFVFKRHYPGIRLLDTRQAFALAASTIAYLLLAPFLPLRAQAVLFLAYIIVHFVFLHYARIFSVVQIARQCLAVVGAK